MTQASPTYLPRLQAIARRGLPSLQVLLVVQVGVYALTTVGPREGFDPLLDGWLRGSAYLTCAAVAALATVAAVRHRRLWELVAPNGSPTSRCSPSR